MDVSIHIHEDDWGMRNLYPVAALQAASADVDEATTAGEANRAPGGGWTTMHVIAAPSADYTSTGLKLADAVAALTPLMPRIRRFTATAMAGFTPGARDPYGSYEEDAVCFGFEACFLKVEPGGDLVKAIWFECRTDSLEQVDALFTAIHALDALVPSVIADYWEDVAGAVQDDAFMSDYLVRLAGA